MSRRAASSIGVNDRSYYLLQGCRDSPGPAAYDAPKEIDRRVTVRLNCANKPKSVWDDIARQHADKLAPGQYNVKRDLDSGPTHFKAIVSRPTHSRLGNNSAQEDWLSPASYYIRKPNQQTKQYKIMATPQQHVSSKIDMSQFQSPAEYNIRDDVNWKRLSRSSIAMYRNVCRRSFSTLK